MLTVWRLGDSWSVSGGVGKESLKSGSEGSREETAGGEMDDCEELEGRSVTLCKENSFLACRM